MQNIFWGKEIMRIIRYKCSGRGGDNWKFSEIEFSSLNLLVGDTATGKTRLLNTCLLYTSPSPRD